MGFGFVVARFGIFLQEIRALHPIGGEGAYGLSLWFGTVLISIGVLVNLSAGWSNIRLIRRLDRGETSPKRDSLAAVAAAFLPALTGLAMAIYLLSVKVPPDAKTYSLAPGIGAGIGNGRQVRIYLKEAAAKAVRLHRPAVKMLQSGN